MALAEPAPLPFPQSEGNSLVYQPPPEDLTLLFAEQFTRLEGRFVYCTDARELNLQFKTLVEQMQWKELYCMEDGVIDLLRPGGYIYSTKHLSQSHVSITTCECLVSRTGSIVMSTAQASGRTASVYAPIHVCIAYTNQLVYDVKDALQKVKEKYGRKLPSLITFATGPSRTADIEKTLVVGVHGPKEVFLFLVEG